MLSIALQKMIDKVETVIFLNTDNSVRVYNDTQMEKTYSPWIYSEIVCTQIVRKKPLLAYRNYLTVEKEYVGIYESVQFAMHSSISYTVSLKHLKKLTERDLECWDREYSGKKQKYEYALDALYEFVCPDEVNGTKRMFSQLESSEIKTLQKVYSIQKESSEGAEEIQSAWNEILDKYWWKCFGGKRYGIAGCE